MESYFHVLNESGLWMVAPVEEQAYQLDGRYTKDPTAAFPWPTKSRNGSARENTEPAPLQVKDKYATH